MQTLFSQEQMRDPGLREADAILRKCVHCGFCNSTCPTFRILGDELDGPRGRIYLIKEMLESGEAPAASTVRHLDRCLSCLSCMTTCPSGVDYMHLSDIARAHVERHHHRPLRGRLQRSLLMKLLTAPKLLARLGPVLRLAAAGARPMLRGRYSAMADLLLSAAPASDGTLAGFYPAPGRRAGTVALLPGCVQQSLGNEINHAMVRLLNRLGYSVQVLSDIACCGAVEQHLGEADRALRRIRTNVGRWGEAAEAGFDALIVNASGCGTVLKDYGHLLREDGETAQAAKEMSAKVMDISQFLDRCDLESLPRRPDRRPALAWQNPCSMLHGQKVSAEPVRLLRRMGFEVSLPADEHLCCGSAGTYNLLQPELARELGQRKANALLAADPEVIASGNLGCMLQLRAHTGRPVLHCVQLLDWATGGPALPG